MAFILLILLTAIAISSTAAYFSVVGLAALFPATATAVIVMGTVLEVGKIVSVKWLHANWKNPSSPRRFKYLMCLFTLPLLIITNVGIYGFLSKGHLEQTTPGAGKDIQIAQIQTQLDQKNADVTRQQKRLDQISKINDSVLAGNAKAGLRASNQNKKESQAIQKTIDDDNQAINDLNDKLTPLKLDKAKIDADLGPVKFVAAALGLPDETAVRIVICLIMSGFDTLALCLFIAFSISLKDHIEKKKAEKPVLPHSELDPEVRTKLDEERKTLEEWRMRLKSEEEVMRNTRAELAERLDGLEGGDTLLQMEREKLEADRAKLEEDKEAFARNHNVNFVDADEMLKISEAIELQEARLQDERELLQQWQNQLEMEQRALNEQAHKVAEEQTEVILAKAALEERVSTGDLDNRPMKDIILDILEANPEVVNDIIETVDAMRPKNKPGL